MNLLWGAMILIGMIYGVFSGRAEDVSEAVLSSAREAVNLSITMMGVHGLLDGTYGNR